MRIETRVFLIEWSDFLEIAEKSRGLGMFCVEGNTVKAAVGRFGAEKTFEDPKELNKAINTLKDYGFVEVFGTKDVIIWLGGK